VHVVDTFLPVVHHMVLVVQEVPRDRVPLAVPCGDPLLWAYRARREGFGRARNGFPLSYHLFRAGFPDPFPLPRPAVLGEEGLPDAP